MESFVEETVEPNQVGVSMQYSIKPLDERYGPQEGHTSRNNPITFKTRNGSKQFTGNVDVLPKMPKI